ncbi:hypothetical protein P879_02656 [Paragonimus westermani]|uniref:Uncharacterized protein n=1 Tax=Paragonimus westermani TaxID=34504 RepID=A0A8T0DRW1_9TREM|nr:hypothetical protein P879_02656 [Paragonimus westermani]
MSSSCTSGPEFQSSDEFSVLCSCTGSTQSRLGGEFAVVCKNTLIWTSSHPDTKSDVLDHASTRWRPIFIDLLDSADRSVDYKVRFV